MATKAAREIPVRLHGKAEERCLEQRLAVSVVLPGLIVLCET
jgi:hypothetical protein